MAFTVALAILGLLISGLALAYQQGWIPSKYVVADFHPEKDPLLLKIFGPPPFPRKPRFIIRYMVPQYKRDQYRIVRVGFGGEFKFGRECIFTGKVSDGSIQEQVLMALPK